MSDLSFSRPTASLRHARRAVIAFFMLHGLLSAAWVVRIPDVKNQLKLSDGELGLALLGAPAGAIAGQFLVGWLLGKFGSKRMTYAIAIIWCFLFPLMGLAPNMLALTVLLFFYGVMAGGLDVAMNSQAALVEKLYGRPIMSFFHGTWSVTSLAAATVGGFLAGHSVPVEWHFLGSALLVLLGSSLAQNWLIKEERPVTAEKHSFVLLPRSLVLLGLLAFCALLLEGAIGDWSAVYLRETLGSPPTEAAAGFIAFSLFMTIARLTGDWITVRLGPARMVRYGGLLTFAGIILFVASPWPYLAIVGCALVGAGIASPFPLVITAAARNPHVPPGRAISAMATVGYSGGLLGPPLIGGMAELISLRGALSLLCVAALTMLLFGGQVQPSTEPNPVVSEVA